ncbi:DUF6261 family protein [Carboxylicivirga linearis]|uniref:Uncharacterized protein n=1 Tax=Carboxylicivirga linearis TaxID=1628157 RepID=A0ABS5JUT9_9BACT|nr:DUF6261 family protein [Carboxylicivirga linearis]MBS2098126.1 hypothetical protein [Carboxylicivirga linearis]
MIQGIKIEKLRNSEFIPFIKNSIQIIQAHPEIKEYISSQLNTLSAGFEIIITKYKQDKSSELTEVLDELDKKRDKTLNGIIQLLEAYTNHYKPSTVESAELLLHSIETFGSSISRIKRVAETSIIDSIVNKWKTEPNLAAVSNLLLAEWLDVLNKENSQFNKTYTERTQKTADPLDLNLKELRKQTTSDYRDLINLIKAYATINKDSLFDAVSGELNSLISQYKKNTR